MVDKNSDVFKRGVETRKWLMGEQYEPAMRRRTEFTEEWMDFVNQYAFGEVWARPGLDKKTRHMLTIAMLTALGRYDELKTHLSLTPNTGVSRDEVKEVLLQASIYAGVPAAMSAFNRANEVFAEMDAKAREEKK
ncbi:MAG TPA: carboxymuconolactone decarboxylase family protein [Stellaceae bacterium]|jgi:4-carboxymuconolactone decarboxylase|nr:carboxymuconolactone decarboxylase family protein [Stellaceae bacterium]